MQRLGTQINMHNNLVSAMQNTMQGQATAAQAEAQGTQALLSGLGGAAATGVKSGIFASKPPGVDIVGTNHTDIFSGMPQATNWSNARQNWTGK